MPSAGLANKAPVRKSILVTDPIPAGNGGRYEREPVAWNVCEEKLAEHEILYAAVLGCSAESENCKAFLVLFNGTLPLVKVFPSTLMTTFNDPKGGLLGMPLMKLVPDIREKVIGASTRMATDEVSPVASSGRYGLMAGEHLRARSGTVDLSGTGNWPPGIVCWPLTLISEG